MTLRIDEAERKSAALDHRIARGNTAIRALKWLTQPDLLDVADLHIASKWGSTASGVGNRDALEYINKELAEVIGSIVAKAIREAQRDMDDSLGNQKEQG